MIASINDFCYFFPEVDAAGLAAAEADAARVNLTNRSCQASIQHCVNIFIYQRKAVGAERKRREEEEAERKRRAAEEAALQVRSQEEKEVIIYIQSLFSLDLYFHFLF